MSCRLVIYFVICPTFEHHKIRVRSFQDRDHTEIGTSRAIRRIGPFHFVYLMDCRVDGAWKTVAMSVAFDLDAPGGHLVAECRCRFQINGVPGKLDEGVAIMIGVRAGYIRTPIAYRRGSRSPHTSLFGRYSGWVDVEARNNQ